MESASFSVSTRGRAWSEFAAGLGWKIRESELSIVRWCTERSVVCSEIKSWACQGGQRGESARGNVRGQLYSRARCATGQGPDSGKYRRSRLVRRADERHAHAGGRLTAARLTCSMAWIRQAADHRHREGRECGFGALGAAGAASVGIAIHIRERLTSKRSMIIIQHNALTRAIQHAPRMIQPVLHHQNQRATSAAHRSRPPAKDEHATHIPCRECLSVHAGHMATDSLRVQM